MVYGNFQVCNLQDNQMKIERRRYKLSFPQNFAGVAIRDEISWQKFPVRNKLWLQRGIYRNVTMSLAKCSDSKSKVNQTKT